MVQGYLSPRRQKHVGLSCSWCRKPCPKLAHWAQTSPLQASILGTLCCTNGARIRNKIGRLLNNSHNTLEVWIPANHHGNGIYNQLWPINLDVCQNIITRPQLHLDLILYSGYHPHLWAITYTYIGGTG